MSQCKCGAEVKTMTHEVKTKKGLSEWSDIKFESGKTYEVEQKKCSACKRQWSVEVSEK